MSEADKAILISNLSSCLAYHQLAQEELDQDFSFLSRVGELDEPLETMRTLMKSHGEWAKGLEEVLALLGWKSIECEHVWVSGDNEVVSGCAICLNCKMITTAEVLDESPSSC